MATIATLVAKLVGDIGPFVTSMKQAETEAKGIGGRISGAMNGALGTIGDVAKIAGTAAVAGIGAATTAAIAGVTAFESWGQQLDTLGDVLGTSANESAALAVAIKGVGGDVDGITVQMAKLAKGLVDDTGKLSTTGKTMQSLGIAFRTSNGQLLPTAQILENVANKLAPMPDGLEKTRLMTELFGKSGKDLSDTMTALADGGLEAAARKADALGLSIGEDGVNKAIAFGRSFEDLKMTLQGLVVSIGSEVMPVLLPLIRRFAEWAISVMPQVRQALHAVFDWIKTNVGPILQDVIAALQNVIAWVQANWPQIQPIIQTVLDAVRGVIGAFVSLAQGDLSGFADSMRGAFQKVIDLVGPVWNTFWTQTLPAAWTTFKQIFQIAWDQFWSTTVPAAWLSFKMLFQILWDQFWGTTVPAAWDSFKKLFQIAWDQFWGTTVPKALTAFIQLFIILWDQFWGTTVPAAWTTFKQLFQLAWDGFWGTSLPAAWNEFKRIVGEAWNTFWNTTVPNAWNTFKTNMIGVWNYFWNVTLPNAVRSAFDYFKTIPAQLLQLGSDIIDGLIKGIQAAGSRIGEVLSGIVNDAINGIKQQLGIGSPSTVFMEMGAQMMQGLALGLQRSDHLPQIALDTALNGLSAEVTPAASTPAGSTFTASYQNNFYDTLATKMFLEQQRLARQQSVRDMF